jgi:cytochrome P450
LRVAPNELSFATVSSFQHIYGNADFIKSEFFALMAGEDPSFSIGTERDPKTHARMKRILLPAFSSKVLADQEHIVRFHVDKFCEKMSGMHSESVNMVEWYNHVAFDLFSDMCFGESFGSLDSGIFFISKDYMIRY